MASYTESDNRLSTRDWFQDSELSPCPTCGNRALVKTDEGDRYCVDCGCVVDVQRPSPTDP